MERIIENVNAAKTAEQAQEHLKELETAKRDARRQAHKNDTGADLLLQDDPVYVKSICKVMLYAKCKTMSTYAAEDCYFVTGQGLMIPSQNYEDYLQECIVTLWNLAINEPLAMVETVMDENGNKVSGLLSRAVSIALNKCYKDMHGRHNRRDKTTCKLVPIEHCSLDENIGTVEMIEDGSNVENDTVMKTDCKRYCKKVLTDISDDVSKIFCMIAAGKSYKTIAKSAGKTENAIRQVVKRTRKNARLSHPDIVELLSD